LKRDKQFDNRLAGVDIYHSDNQFDNRLARVDIHTNCHKRDIQFDNRFARKFYQLAVPF
jgi:hypothetical protein